MDCSGSEVCQSNECIDVEAGCTVDADCDDQVYCNGAERCNVDGECQAGTPVCLTLLCDESAQACVECLVDADCDDLVYCNGAERCDINGECSAGSPTCVPLLCDESARACVECLGDADCGAEEVCENGVCRPPPECTTGEDCDDGMICNGTEACANGVCVPGSSLCGAGQTCDEEGNRCWDDVLTLDLGSRVTMELVLIAPGTFRMGADGVEYATPVHRVTISDYFYIGRYEVTQAQWEAVRGTNPSHFDDGGDLPVETVDWYGARNFCADVSDATGQTVRLPSEAEWEYACRAGTTTTHFFGDSVNDLGDYAWYEDNSLDHTHEVGTKLPNPWGLYDMYGNVKEWCADKWHDDYIGAPSDGSAWTEGDEFPDGAPNRGCSYLSGSSCFDPVIRDPQLTDYAYTSNGFRVVVIVPE
jgi:formylglycine-generating enzyme required for sulfatase activity